MLSAQAALDIEGATFVFSRSRFRRSHSAFSAVTYARLAALQDPSFEVDLVVAVGLKTMTGVRLGDLSLDRALRNRDMTLEGSKELARQFRSWLKPSVIADIERTAKAWAAPVTRPTSRTLSYCSSGSAIACR